MVSQVDPTKPEHGSATTQSVRDNFLHTKNELEALQAAIDAYAAANSPIKRRYTRVKTASYTIQPNDLGAIIKFTGAVGSTFTLPLPADAGDGWWCVTQNAATGGTTPANKRLIVAAPAGGSLLDDLALTHTYPGDTRTITCDGTNFYSSLTHGGFIQFDDGDTGYQFIPPTGDAVFTIEVLGGGAGGASGARGAGSTVRAGGGGGGGGSYVRAVRRYRELIAQAATWGIFIASRSNGGTSITTDNTGGQSSSGLDGKSSSFGSSTWAINAYGGRRGGGGTTAALGGSGAGALAAAAGSSGGPPSLGSGNTSAGQFGGSDAALSGVVDGLPSGWGGASGGGTPSSFGFSNGGSSLLGGPGGGSGGSILAANGDGKNGGAGGGDSGASAGGVPGGQGGKVAGVGTPATAGSPGVELRNGQGGGGSGGGAGADNTGGGVAGPGAPGGDGGVGAGGGGGGASMNGQPSGAGGRGGPGRIRIDYRP